METKIELIHVGRSVTLKKKSYLRTEWVFITRSPQEYIHFEGHNITDFQGSCRRFLLKISGLYYVQDLIKYLDSLLLALKPKYLAVIDVRELWRKSFQSFRLNIRNKSLPRKSSQALEKAVWESDRVTGSTQIWHLGVWFTGWLSNVGFVVGLDCRGLITLQVIISKRIQTTLARIAPGFNDLKRKRKKKFFVGLIIVFVNNFKLVFISIYFCWRSFQM